ncbi:hypothetical protein AAG570_009276 [Ranatra chinensis]|uniref:Disease resistance R13L4/SHOC-2-like LRR domain-containing protein n=1 Tax=Ranatra chinensis TaxID=642074 RepID=A0ABD0YTE3_9HEMI
MEFYSSESGSGSDSGGARDSCSVKTLDVSYKQLENCELEEAVVEGGWRGGPLHNLVASHNRLTSLPESLASAFNALRHLDLSNNRLASLPDFLVQCPLTALVAVNNQIPNSGLPKTFAGWSSSLKMFNLAGNRLDRFPGQLAELISLKHLYLGSNTIEEIPTTIDRIVGLRVLCLGGNRLSDIPESVGRLEDLEVLVLSDNLLESLPPTVANLKRLRTLQLHKNRLRTLPTEIITLSCLSELSLRDNPLVVQFVSDMANEPGNLREISARVVKIAGLAYSTADLPQSLVNYLNSAHHCVNPTCNGVYFNSRVEHIKFVDFCGKYRIPLLQYLCSSKCVKEDHRPSSPQSRFDDMMRKVLLG